MVERADRPISFVRADARPSSEFRAQQGISENARRVTNRVVPPDPLLVCAMNVKGIVRLEVLVAANGTIKSVKVIGGHPVLTQAAERAVLKWRWSLPGVRAPKQLN